MSKNLVRFDWAIKRLLRQKANFAVLEGLLSEILREDVKIKHIAESEGNKETAKDKYNRVDILVQNMKGELLIVEVQVEMEHDYLHRILYGTSKAITEYMKSGDVYGKVKKVYSVSIVYFELGQGKDYVYHGTTFFQGIHQKDTLALSERQKEIYQKTSVSAIFPEYYILKVNNFNGIAKNTLDEWLYFLKHSEVKATFKAKGLKEANEVLNEMNLTPKQRKEYLAYMEVERSNNSFADTVKIELDAMMKIEMAKLAEMRKIDKAQLEEEKAQLAEEKAQLEEARKIEKAQLEEARKIEKAQLEEARKIEKVQLAEEKAQLEEARKIEKAQLEEARKIEKAQLEEARKIEKAQLEEVRKTKDYNLVTNLFVAGISIDIIATSTGLTVKEVADIVTKLKK
jgi:predicted transposase/invertase (TIGR01784 family)